MTATVLISPYIQDEGALWLRGNLHVHTTRSDGSHDPGEVAAKYASLGYDFLGFSDHNVFWKPDGVDGRGMILLPGVEVGSGKHVLNVGAKRNVEGSGGAQDVIRRIRASGGMPVLCHPSWQEHYNHYTFEEMRGLARYAGIEIFNGAVLRAPGNPLATDKWDRLLSMGRKVWGFAGDDAHGLTGAGRGWVVVRARGRGAKEILEALRRGSFYASTGVRIESIECSGARLRLASPDAEAMAVLADYGSLVYRTDGCTLDFDASSLSATYVRVECYGRGGAFAWTQPFFLRGGPLQAMRRRIKALEKGPRPVLRAPILPRSPKMTGAMDDPLWRKAPASSRFFGIGDGGVPPVRTEMRCMAAEGMLFLGFRCEEPEMDKLKLEVQTNGHPGTWTDDALEIFLDVEGAARGYFQVMVNAAGYINVGRYGTAKTGKIRAKASAGRYAKGWILEIALPLKDLGASARRGSEWGLHICRNRHAGGRRGSFVWAWVGASNHTPERFGRLAFG